MIDPNMKTKLTSVSLSDVTNGEHVVGAFIGKSTGPTLIVVGSLHGNEPSGAIALSNLSQKLTELTAELNGRVYFLTGNTRALRRGVRFIDADLNRSWTPHNMSKVGSEELCATSEGVELTEIDQILDSILITAMDEVFVLDLHSTSADGVPFATVGDTLRNREFVQSFPITILLGIEEQLDGTLLEYLNNAGAVTLGFEGGQHLSEQTVKNHEALIWLALVNAKIIDASKIVYYGGFIRQLTEANPHKRIVEVRYRHAITSDVDFKMNPGFDNFDQVRKGQVLGKDRNGPVKVGETGLMLMPLYQYLGEDGFFIGREISRFWLWLSGVLRYIGLQKIVHLLPGVRHDPNDPATLLVDTHVARLFPLQVFHLLGFRRRRWSENKLVVSRRKHDTDGPFKWKGT
jgi:succinylglutamate desuccinylase